MGQLTNTIRYVISQMTTVKYKIPNRVGNGGDYTFLFNDHYGYFTAIRPYDSTNLYIIDHTTKMVTVIPKVVTKSLFTTHVGKYIRKFKDLHTYTLQFNKKASPQKVTRPSKFNKNKQHKKQYGHKTTDTDNNNSNNCP